MFYHLFYRRLLDRRLLCIIIGYYLNQHGPTYGLLRQSFYSDAKCEKPIAAEKGEAIVSHIEVDSSEEYAQCREIKGGGYGNHYQFYCHPNGNEISGKLLCNPTCKACLISTEDKKADGTSDFPLGEMKLDTCLSVPEMEGSYMKFIGECPDQKPVQQTWAIVLIVVAVCFAVGCVINGFRKTNPNGVCAGCCAGCLTRAFWRNTMSPTAVAVLVDDGAYNAPEYDQM